MEGVENQRRGVGAGFKAEGRGGRGTSARRPATQVKQSPIVTRPASLPRPARHSVSSAQPHSGCSAMGSTRPRSEQEEIRRKAEARSIGVVVVGGSTEESR